MLFSILWNYTQRSRLFAGPLEKCAMNQIIYLIGLIVVIGLTLSFLGLRYVFVTRMEPTTIDGVSHL